MQPALPQLPFLTREMLSFGNTAQLQIRVTSHSRNASRIFVRGMTRSGFFEFRHDTSSDTTPTETDYGIDDIPIHLTVSDDIPIMEKGDCHVSVDLLLNGEKIFSLCSGYVYFTKSIAWPYNNQTDFTYSQGAIRETSGTNPAAGANFSYTENDFINRKISAIRFDLTTDANAADRYVQLTMNSTSRLIVLGISNTAHTASLTRSYTCATWGYLPSTANDDDILIPIPLNLIQKSGDSIKSAVTGIQVGDAITSIKIYGEQWILPYPT